MRCAILSRAGQVLARGHLIIHGDEAGDSYLAFRSDRGRIIQGGKISPSGDLTEASKVLFRQLFEAWGMTDLTLTVSEKAQRKLPHTQSSEIDIELI
ncbi:MAG: hypothetical protein F6K03_06965 [Kamptonema sp. SIO4C4]|nr:hypothetical protein [Kamptonema sp. SIO4C4]